MKGNLFELDNEEMQNNETNLQIEPWITDFWTQNISYKRLIESAEIVGMNNRELEKAINKNLQSLYGSEFDWEMQVDQNLKEKNDVFLNETIGNEIESQVVFMWRCNHYWPKSIAAKMNLSKIKVNKILSRYKALARKAQKKNFKMKIGTKWIIKEQHIDKIKQYIESINCKPIKIDMIKNAVWSISSNERPPWNLTISKALKNKLKMSYKILHKWNTKRRDSINNFFFMESLYFQAKFRTNEYEAIYVDEFKFSSRN